MSRGWISAIAVAVTLGGALTTNRASAEQLAFQVNPSVSSVDLTAYGFVFGRIASTRDTQSFPIGGSLTLDVDVAGGEPLAVDFVDLRFDYVADLEDPVVFEFTTLVPDPFTLTPAGVESEVRVPFDPEVASGNPITPFDPTMTLSGEEAGVESGEGGALTLTAPTFRFVGTGQSFGESSTPDGFPVNFGPYPNTTPFPDLPPDDRDEVTFVPDQDFPNFPVTPPPEGPNLLQGTVTSVDGEFVFQGSFFSFGAGGAGQLVYPQIHEGSFFASTGAVLPGDYNRDGVVDAADYTVWRDNFGAPAGTLPNDLDGGPIGTAQLATWQSFFGAVAIDAPAESTFVPEPGTCGLVLSLLAMAASHGARSMSVALSKSRCSHAIGGGLV